MMHASFAILSSHLPRAILLAPLLGLAACSGGDGAQVGNSVTMRDMAVQDGTATDSMTDLDAARVDGTQLENPPADNAAKPAAANNGTAAAPGGGAEVVADD